MLFNHDNDDGDDNNESFISVVKGTIICLNVPKLFEFGIDNYSYKLGSEFRGINQIPLHLPHFIYYNRIDHEKFGNGQGPRISFFHIFTEEMPLLILEFDEQEDDFKFISSDDDKFKQIASQYRSGVFLKQIAPYNDDMRKNWNELVSFIDFNFLERIEPVSKKIHSTLLQEEQEEDEKKPNILHYTPVPQKLTAKGLTPEEITRLNFDKSQLLIRIIKSKRQMSEERAFRDLFAEIQFSFICLLHGQCLHGLSQWKKLVHLFCNCEDALLDNNEQFILFIQVLRNQFEMLPRDFIQDMVENDFDLDEEQLLDVTKNRTNAGDDDNNGNGMESQQQQQQRRKPPTPSKRDHFLQKTLLQLFLTTQSIEEDGDYYECSTWKNFSKAVKNFKQFMEKEFEGCKDMFCEDDEDIPTYVYQ